MNTPDPDFTCLDDVFAAAERKLTPEAWAFLDGGAGEEATLAANRAAFQRWSFRPRVLAGIDRPDLRATFLGEHLSLPVLTAPFGADALFHPSGLAAVARAAQSRGTAAVVAEASSNRLEDVIAAAPQGARFFQIHPVGSHDQVVRMGRRAASAGYRGLVVTADCPVGGWRERLRRIHFSISPDLVAANFEDHQDPTSVIASGESRSWTWAELRDVCSSIGLPFAVKGVLTREDARASVEIGASGVVVSNHGGRQLDGAPASLDQLAEVVDEVGADIDIALDSGVRRGTDVVKALALGANVVMIGRAAASGLAADGEAGVACVLDLLRDEIATTLTLLGRGSVAALDRTAVQEARP